MKKIFAFLTIAIGGVLFAASAANAHIVENHTEDCDGVAVTFKWFPQGDHVITLEGEEVVQKTFSGSAGTVSATWQELGFGSDTPGASWYYSVSWTADGGGSDGPFNFNVKGCEPAPEPETPVVTEPEPEVPVTPAPEPTPEPPFEESTPVVETEIIPPISEERPPVVETEVTPVVPMLPHTGSQTESLLTAAGVLVSLGVILISLDHFGLIRIPRILKSRGESAAAEVKQDQ